MTERERLLEAVAEAADGVRQWRASLTQFGGTSAMHPLTAHAKLFAALEALDAHQPQPAAGETVEVAVAVRMNTRGQYVAFGDSRDPKYADAALEWVDGADFPHIATLTARVPLPTVPTIDAEVRT